MASMKKPLRIWSCDRQVRHGVVAENWKDTLQKGAVKLGIPFSDDLKLVTEEDGSVVDSTFWEKVDDHTRLILLQPQEEWVPPPLPVPQHIEYSADSVDSSSDDLNRALSVLLELRKNPASVMLLNMFDLEVVKDMDVETLKLNSLTAEMAKQLQDLCIEVYIQKKTEADALEYITLLKENVE